MGCGISTPRFGQDLLDDEATQKRRTRLARSLDLSLPAADDAKNPLPTQPVGWTVFPTERERNHFIRDAMLVLSDNGVHDIHHLPVELFYSRVGARYFAAQMAVMEKHNITHAIVGQRYGEDQRKAFLYLKHEIERQLDIILRRKHRTVTDTKPDDDWDEPLARKVRKTQSRQSVQHKQPSRRASRQSIIPTSTPAGGNATTEQLTEMIGSLPPSTRRSLIAQCASPDDLSELYDVPESTAIAAKRRSALYIPPLDSHQWNETRLQEQQTQPNRSDSMANSSAVAKRTTKPRPFSDCPHPNKASASSTALTTMAQLPMIQHAGRYGNASASRHTNDEMIYSNGRYRQRASAMYELSYYGKEDLWAQNSDDGNRGDRGAGGGGGGGGRAGTGSGYGARNGAGRVSSGNWDDMVEGMFQ